MNPRFITKNIHAYLDYPVAIVLMAAPFLLGLGGSHPIALWLGVITGVAALILTLFTDHMLGAVRVIPYRVHLLVDAAVGATFLLAPLAFGFTGIDALFYWANGLAVAAVVSLHKPEPQPTAAMA